MTTLYRPVLIESAEQAEALPEGTVAMLSEDIGDGQADFYAATKAENDWERTDSSGPSWMSPAPDSGMVGWTALVPIEAEEETAAFVGIEASMPVPIGPGVAREDRGHLASLPRHTRYVTPWQET